MATESIQKRKVPVINTITHHEVQLLYGLTQRGAENRIGIIRATLGKTPMQKLSVIDFCKVEGYSVEDFDLMMQRAYSR